MRGNIVRAYYLWRSPVCYLENLIRAELTAAQRASAIKRRKALWEQRHGEAENQVAQVAPPEIGYKKPPKQERQFAADTAERTRRQNQRRATGQSLRPSSDAAIRRR